MSSHWATPYIGTPWRRGASGPDSFDCWGFAVMVQKNHFNRTLPDIEDRHSDSIRAAHTIKTHEERDNWYEVQRPQEGDIVLMARRNVPVHVGVWILANNRGGVLHCVEKSGVVFSDRYSLSSMGFGGISYYHPKGQS